MEMPIPDTWNQAKDLIDLRNALKDLAQHQAPASLLAVAQVALLKVDERLTEILTESFT